jgi:hypothetical protein
VWVHCEDAPECIVALRGGALGSFKLPSRGSGRMCVVDYIFRVCWNRRVIRVYVYEATAPTEVQCGSDRLRVGSGT